MCLVSWPNCLFPFFFLFFSLSKLKKQKTKNVSHYFFTVSFAGLNILLLSFYHFIMYIHFFILNISVTVIELCNRNKFQFLDNRGSTFQFNQR